MAVPDREQGSAADIRELRGIVIDLAIRLGRLEGQMKVVFALLIALLAIAIAILIRVW